MRFVALKPGDTLGVFALSSPFDPQLLDKGVARIKEMGFAVKRASNLGLAEGYLAGEDEQRAAGFNELLHDSSVRALIAARGGYGCSRVLPLIEFEALEADPRPIIGCSDLTMLQMLLLARGLPCIHGPMVASQQMIQSDTGGNRLRSLLLRTDQPQPIRPEQGRVLRPGNADGKLIGGNLTMIVNALAAGVIGPELFDGALLFLEETNERQYRIDRMLTTLRLSSILERINGLILGSFLGDIDDTTLDRLALQSVGSRKIPIAAGFPVGHGDLNLALPLGVQARLQGVELSFG
ncbi:MAG: LD-carboxypeptidase [Candidatus Alcyoniella australis]|nr:LD-carboxypeptidase [Candidatus Alcyoniella australis]